MTFHPSVMDLTPQEVKDMFEGLESALGKSLDALGGLDAIADAIAVNSVGSHTFEESANKIMNSTLELAEAQRSIASHLTSPNEMDSNGEPANVVDGLFAIAAAIRMLANK